MGRRRARARLKLSMLVYSATVAVVFTYATPVTATSIEPPVPSAPTASTAPEAVVADMPPIDIDALAARLPGATAAAAARGADVSMVLLDRATGATAGVGGDDPIATASVSKLFIADDILYRAATGEFVLSPVDRATLDRMLQASDDNAAQSLWDRFGESDMVTRVALRYGLSSTNSSRGDAWWNTTTTMADVVEYYVELADGTGGLAADTSGIVIGDLAAFTDNGADGYDQRFGIPAALQSATDVAVKQGWMCCVDGDWLHLSTGYLGADRRIVLAVGSREVSDGWADDTAPHARDTITRFLADALPPDAVTPAQAP